MNSGRRPIREMTCRRATWVPYTINSGNMTKPLRKTARPFASTRSGLSYANLVNSYLYLNRLEEARATAEEAQAKNLDSPILRFILYQLAFLQNDAAGMAQQVAWAAGKPGVEDVLLAERSRYGRLFRAAGESPGVFPPGGGLGRAGGREGDGGGLRSRRGRARSPVRQCSRSPATGRGGARAFNRPGRAVWSGAGAGLRRGCGPNSGSRSGG